MIVGFDATTLHGEMSGVGYYTARLMESLANGAGDGVIERLVVLSHREVPAPNGRPVQVYGRHRFRVRLVWMQLVLPWILRRLKPDLVHFTNYLAPLAGGAPYLVSFHDMTLSLFPECHPLQRRLVGSTLLPRVARGARLVLVPSQSTRRDVVRLLGVEPARVRVIPYAASPRFRPTQDGPERLDSAYGVRRPYFLYVGTLEPRKNLSRALRAFARVVPSLPDHCFVLVGQRGWKYQEVLREAERPELSGRVRFLGYVPENDLPLFYRHATALVYPSLYEGFGLPVVEAMACGTPVLTSRSSSLTEISDGAALLVDPYDETAISTGLLALATDPALRADLAARGVARAATYSWERTGRETAAAYREIHVPPDPPHAERRDT
jgi:glycosyltransferase involved in cell wall biosynthesis